MQAHYNHVKQPRETIRNRTARFAAELTAPATDPIMSPVTECLPPATVSRYISGRRLLGASLLLSFTRGAAVAAASVPKYAAEQAALSRAFATFPTFAAACLAAAIGCLLLIAAIYRFYLNQTAGSPAHSSSMVVLLFRARWVLSALTITVVFLISNHLLVRGIGVGVWDADSYYFPYYVLTADYARFGQLARWDPWANGGLPIVGDPMSGAFSPLTLLVGLIAGGTSFGFIAYWLLMWWLGGIGLLLLARELRAPAWGACVVTLGFLFCGAYTGHAENISYVISFSFLPWVVWRLDSALSRRSYRPAIEAGALWGLSALSGYPGLTILTGCFCALWALGRSLWPESFDLQGGQDNSKCDTYLEERLKPRFVVSVLTLFVITGSLALSPSYVAFLFEGAGVHTRVGAVSRVAATALSLYPGTLSTFATPWLTTLKLFRDDLWPVLDASSCSIYGGALVFILAVFAVVNRLHSGWRSWLAGLAALSLACALGNTLPFRGWLYDWFYPMRFFQGSYNFRLYYLFPLAILALLGTRDLTAAFQLGRRTLLQFVVAAGVTALCAISVSLAFVAWPKARISAPILVLGYCHVFVWASAFAVAVLIWRSPHSARRWLAPIALVTLAAGDALLTSVISTPLMVRASNVEHWKALDARHSTRIDTLPNGLLRAESACYPNPPCTFINNDQYVTKVPVFDAYSPQENGFHLEMVANPVLRGMATGADRIWFARDVGRVSPTEASFTEFVSRTGALGVSPLLVHSREEMLVLRHNGFQARMATDTERLPLSINHVGDESFQERLKRLHEYRHKHYDSRDAARIRALPSVERVRTDLIRYGPDEISFIVRCPAAGWLLVTDRWARSWNAEVDGRPSTVYGANFIFRAIQVHAGENLVRFAYRPSELPWLIILSWGILVTIAGVAVFSKFVSGRANVRSVLTVAG